MFAAIVLFAFQVNAQNKKVNFVAEMSFGRVSYLSPSCLSVVNPEECDVTSFGMNLKMGVDLKGFTLKADLSSFGGAYFYDTLSQKREETGLFMQVWRLDLTSIGVRLPFRHLSAWEC